MDNFVRRANLERLRRVLAEAKDEIQRRQIEKLIAEEEAKAPTPRD